MVHPGSAGVSRSDLADQIVTSHKCKKENIIMFGFRTQFGGGRSSGFCLIYDNEKALKKFTPKYMLIRVSTPLWALYMNVPHSDSLTLPPFSTGSVRRRRHPASR